MAATAKLLNAETVLRSSLGSTSDHSASKAKKALRHVPPCCLRENASARAKLKWKLRPGAFFGTLLQNKENVLTLSRPLRISIQRQACRASASPEKGTIAVAGGTGFIGSKLVEKLLEDEYKVKVLTRSSEKARSIFSGRQVEVAEPYQWNEALAGVTGVVNLVGTPIATRWNSEVKVDIKASRVKTTKRLVEAINRLPEDQRPKVFVSSSALGYYGISDTERFVEDSPSGNDYLAEVCREWEAAAKEVKGPRLVLLRTGIVLDKDGGALAKMIPLFQLFAGGPLGSGKQWFSWVHRDDLAGLILEALQNPKYEGPINGTAPNPVTFAEMCDKLGQALGRPSWLPVPDFAIRSLLGEGASTVLEGQRVLPKKAQDLGFRFKYPEISGALRAIVAS